MMDEVLANWKTANIPEYLRAALWLLECLTLQPMALDKSFVRGLRDSGLDDPAMYEAANVSFPFNLINRLADAFDFELLNAKQEAVYTKMLNQIGKHLKGNLADPIWIRDVDGQIRPTEFAQARQPLLSSPGKTTPTIRRAIEAFVVTQRGKTRSQAGPIPEELTHYLKKLDLTAYKITDKNIDGLRTAGYDDETIYEITVAGAFGQRWLG